jgi:hypothetical protein
MRLGRTLAKRGLSIAFVPLAIAVSAAAYGDVGSTIASKPLTGRVPGVAVVHQRGVFSASGYDYRIVVEPSLQAGTAGWMSSLFYSLPGRPGTGSGGGGGYPTKHWPLFADSGGFSFYPRGQAPAGDVVDYVLTGPEVAAVRVDNLTIQTFSDPQLPMGDRAAVFFRRAAAPPAFAIPGTYRPRHAVRVVPLDAAGHVIPTRLPLEPSFGSSRYWQAPSAITPNIHEPPYHGPTGPLPGACELAQHGLPGLVPEWGHVIGHITGAKGSEGEVFLPCIDTEYYLHGWPLEVAVLLDAAQPGRVLGPIPGAQPVLGHPGVVTVPADQFPGSLTAKQVGQAWLVVQGGASPAQRLRVLSALAIAKLALRGAASGAGPGQLLQTPQRTRGR